MNISFDNLLAVYKIQATESEYNKLVNELTLIMKW